MQKNSIKVVELFAGVGGFRLGLENSSKKFETIWANQWEPGRISQHAYDCYVSHFGTENHINEDIAKVKQQVPNHDLLVGGFPCQDYSVARTQAKGIEGKKGVLWWEINDIVKEKRPNYILLENVDRLLRSPANQRGRDFGVILRCLFDLGYAVEWRVINAAEYGFAQRRRRVFIFAYKNCTNIFKGLSKSIDKYEWLHNMGLFMGAFPVKAKVNIMQSRCTDISPDKYTDLAELSIRFSSHLYNSGVMINGKVYSEQTKPIEITPLTLKSIVLKTPVDTRYFLDGKFDKWKFLKGAKRIERKRPNGETYYYAEGRMKFPDDLNLPARTMLTSESSVNRSTHVIKDIVTGELRLLTPIECESLNGFPLNWTNTGMPEKFRYFVMGNALVVPVVTTIANELLKIID